jgi:glycosyltransferase involved in cell wall biosynthesis
LHVLISAISRFTSPTGICRHAANLAACLESRPEIDRVTLVTGEWQSYYRDLVGIQSPKLCLIPINLRNDSISRNRWFLFELPRFAGSQSADIVHLSFPVPIRRTHAYKTVVTLHDLYPYDCPEVFGYPNVHFNRLFLHNCLKNVDGIACVSDTTKSRMEALFSSKVARKSRVIPNIVRRDPAPARRPQNWPDNPFILVVAQHRRNKNLGLAIRGFSELRRRSMLPTDTRLVIVGSEGPETGSIVNEISRLGLSNEVVLPRSLPDPELYWLYENCLLFLVTSTHEGFCLPLLEALHTDCRIVCSDIPVLRESGRTSVAYFDLRETPESLVEAAGTALSQPHRAPEDIYRVSQDGVAQIYIDLYNSLGGSRRRAPEVVAV